MQSFPHLRLSPGRVSCTKSWGTDGYLTEDLTGGGGDGDLEVLVSGVQPLVANGVTSERTHHHLKNWILKEYRLAKLAE